MKAVASRLVWGTGRSKTAVRAEIVTGTDMFMHVLAAAEPASTVSARAGLANMFEIVGALGFTTNSVLSAQLGASVTPVLLKVEGER